MCAEYVSPISNTTVEAKGTIPLQYWDTENSIDRIKITSLESGQTFDALVNNDGTWSTTIEIAFNNNQSHFIIDGYNSNDAQNIIATQGLMVVHQ